MYAGVSMFEAATDPWSWPSNMRRSLWVVGYNGEGINSYIHVYIQETYFQPPASKQSAL